MFRAEPYNTVGTSPMWPFEYKLIKIKCKIQFSVAPATFQMLTSHVWLWLLYWTAQTENISTMAESSIGQHCSTAKAANKTCVQWPVDMYWHSWLSMKKTKRKGRRLLCGRVTSTKKEPWPGVRLLFTKEIWIFVQNLLIFKYFQPIRKY